MLFWYRSNDPDQDHYVVGETSEIRQIYKSITRANRECKSDIAPYYSDFPIFSGMKSVYGLKISDDGFLTVLSSDTIMDLIVGGYIVPVKERVA